MFASENDISTSIVSTAERGIKDLQLTTLYKFAQAYDLTFAELALKITEKLPKDFSLIEKMNKPIYSIHYPLDRCDIMEIAKEYKTDYAQIGIRGDCVYSIYSAQKQEDLLEIATIILSEYIEKFPLAHFP